MTVEIKKFSEESIDDFLAFFDERAFCNNPDWAGCYCRFYYNADDSAWEAATAAQNREAAVTEIKSGSMNGYLAYLDDRPVGWCNADSLASYPRIMHENAITPEAAAGSAAVVCFIVDPDFRRMGVAAALLERVCSDFKTDGVSRIEAYPRKDSDDDAGNYHGPLAMYRRAGFEIVSDEGEYYIVRKAIG